MSGGKFSRDKGAAGERELAGLLRRVWANVARNLTQYQAMSGRDFTGTGRWVVQCKRLAKPPAVEAMLREAQAEVETFDQAAVLLVRGDRGEWLAVTYLDDFLDLVDAEQTGVQPVSVQEFLEGSDFAELRLVAGGAR